MYYDGDDDDMLILVMMTNVDAVRTAKIPIGICFAPIRNSASSQPTAAASCTIKKEIFLISPSRRLITALVYYR